VRSSDNKIDFAKLGSELLSNATSLLYDWLPGGKVVGHEFECGNLSGIAGRSLRVNINTGKWADFSSDSKGGDLISLYAAIHRISQVDAAKKLGGQPQPSMANDTATKNGANGNGHAHGPSSGSDAPVLIPPPKGTKRPNFTHRKLGEPTGVWTYRDGSGAVLYFVARYQEADGSKQFFPFSWSSAGKWVMKAWPEPRPLYGLDALVHYPDRPVIVVEGEKAAEAAAKICGTTYVVVTWQGGSKAWKKTDFTPLHGRKVLLWPDADATGVQAMADIAGVLLAPCVEVKVLNVGTTNFGHDAADHFDVGMDWPKFKVWAKAIVRLIEPIQISARTSAEPAAGKQDQPPDSINRIQNKAKEIEVLPAAQAPPQISIEVKHPDDPEEQPVSLHAAWERMGLAMTQKQGPIVNIDNVMRILQEWPAFKGKVWFDDFRQRTMTSKDGKQRPWQDVDDIDLCVYLQRHLGIPKMQPRIAQAAVDCFAFQNKRDEPKDWMETLKWDGSKRIDHFFAQAFGAEDNEYTTAASKNWWIAMVARVYRPGCKFDNMVVLEGNQGKFKSTALGIIGGEWFMESSETLGTKDFLQSLNGKLLIEIAELDSFSKADVKTIKKTISCQIDTYRASFGRRAQDFARRCVFVGSTNEDEYLEDPTGGRRFWPIKTGDIDLDMIREHRNQLFAEAVHRFKLQEQWWIMPKLAAQEQESRRRSDAWEDLVLPWLSGREKVRLNDVATGCFKIDAADFDKRTQMRLGAVMRSLGWERRTARLGTKLDKVWVRGPKADAYVATPDMPLTNQDSLFSRPAGVRNYAPGAEQ
jgi:predicted P-loop ATPase